MKRPAHSIEVFFRSILAIFISLVLLVIFFYLIPIKELETGFRLFVIIGEIILISIIASLLHEFAHAVFFPDHGFSNDSVCCFIPRQFLCFVQYKEDSYEPGPRWDSVLCTAGPFILLSILPLFLAWIFRVHRWEVAFLIIANTLLSVQDLYTILNILLRTPRDSLILCDVFELYYKDSKQDQGDPTHERKKSLNLAFLASAVVILLCMVCLILFIVPAILRHSVLKSYPPEERAQYNTWLCKRFSFTPEQLKVPLLSGESLRLSKKLRHDYKNALENKSREKRSLKDQLENLSFLETFTSLTLQQDYDMNYILDVTELSGATGGFFLYDSKGQEIFPFILSLFCVRSALRSGDGDHEGALWDAETIFRASRHHQLSEPIVHIWSYYNLGFNTWYGGIENCDDPKLLRKTLDFQNTISPERYFPPPDIPLFVLDFTDYLIHLKRLGYDDILPYQGLNGPEMSGYKLVSASNIREKYVLSTATDLKKREEIQNNIKSLRSIGKYIFGYAPGKNWFEKFKSSCIAPFFLPPLYDEKGFLERKKRTQVKFDMLRLFTALKLFLLETGKEPDNFNQLIPDYLSRLPCDPYKSDGGVLNHKPKPYSVGPDGIDQKAAIPYDPTNGTKSPGDIYIKGFRSNLEI